MGRLTVGLLTVLTAWTILWAPAASADPPMATLDPTFGSGGLLRLPEGGLSVKPSAFAGEDLLLGDAPNLIRVLSGAGGAGMAFGGDVSLAPLAGSGEFLPGDLAVDSRGRLVVAGTYIPAGAERKTVRGLNESPVDFTSSNVRIYRFRPDGRLDPTFGAGGIVETDFGLPPPGHEQPYIATPAVGASGVAVDFQGHIVVTGSVEIGIGESCIHDDFKSVRSSAPYIARLTESGALDPTFSGDGLVGGRSPSETPLGEVSLGKPVIGPEGTITYSTSAVGCGGGYGRYGVAQLTSAGLPRQNLGREGALGGYFPALAVASDGSVIAVARMNWREGEKFRARIVRITPGGEVDLSFGRHGQEVVRLGAVLGNEPDSVAIDSQGRILLGATFATAKHRFIMLARSSTDGRQEKNFGPHGKVAVAVPGLLSFGPGQLFIDPQGRAVTVHRYRTPSGSGVILARFLLRD